MHVLFVSFNALASNYDVSCELAECGKLGTLHPLNHLLCVFLPTLAFPILVALIVSDIVPHDLLPVARFFGTAARNMAKRVRQAF